MSIRHHPDESLLLAYASGTADEATGLIIATHMAFCTQCRQTVTLMEKIGGRLLENLPAAPLSRQALDATLARLDEPVPMAARTPAPSRDGTPQPLRAYLGGDLSGVRWRRIGPSLAYKPLFRRGGISAKLLRGAPGQMSAPIPIAAWNIRWCCRAAFPTSPDAMAPATCKSPTAMCVTAPSPIRARTVSTWLSPPRR